MDYSASRSRIGGVAGGSGPQLVKTYGRFRQRIVNREAKVAEDFARMTGARPLVSDLLDSSSDSDFDTPPQQPQASIPLVREPSLAISQTVQPPTTSRASRAKRASSAAINTSTNTPLESSKPAGSRARKPKPTEVKLIPPAQAKVPEKPPSKRTSSARVSKPKPARKATKSPSDTLALSQSAIQEAESHLDRLAKLEETNAAVKVDEALANGSLYEPLLPTEQPVAAPALPKEVTRRRLTRARASSASNQSPRKPQERPRKASRVLSDTNAEPFASAISAAGAMLEDIIPSDDAELPPEHTVAIVVSSISAINGSIHTADLLAPIGSPIRAKEDAHTMGSADMGAHLDVDPVAEAESQKIEHSPISGGNVTRRRGTTRGRRPTAADRAPIAIDHPVLAHIKDVDDEVLTTADTYVVQSSSKDEHRSNARQTRQPLLAPNGGLNSVQVSATSAQGISSRPADVVASGERRRSSRLMRLPPDETIRELNTLTTASAEDTEHGMEDDPVQHRQLLGTRPMRFKAPRNARVQTFDAEDIENEVQADGAAEADTQYDLLSTPTRRSTAAVHGRQSSAEPSMTPIPLSLPVIATHGVSKDTRDHPLEAASIQPLQTPPRSHQGGRRTLDHHKTPVPTATPRRDRQSSASYLPDVPHSPARVATPHRVIYSPPHPMTHFKPATTRAIYGSDMISAMPGMAQLGSAPGAPSNRARVSEPIRPSLPTAPQLRLSSGSATGRMSTSGDVSGELEIEETRVPFLPARRYVQKGHILAACGQTAPIDWVAGGLQACGVLLPELDSSQHSDAQMGELESESGLCKIGEATYSEVFSAQWRYVPRTRYDNFNSKKGKVKGERLMQVALKVIPFGNSSVKSGTGEPQTTLRDLYQEIGATLALSRLSERERAKLQEARLQVKKPLKPKERELGANFVKAFRVCICQGPLPAPLLRAWDRWKTEYPDLCENMRPDYYPPNQLFAVFVLEMGGETLENAAVSTWKEARSIVRQLALSMALAERHNQFEHRDLHWGNIMVTRSNSNLTFLYQLPPTGARVKSALMSIPSYKVRCTIIDYTLSRLHIDNDDSDATANKPANYDPAKNVFFVALKDESLFQGQGDIQYDVYRQMRQCSKDDWEGFHPHTNVMWLTYALQKILVTKAPAIRHELVEFAESKLGPAFDAVPVELKRAAGQELLKRWIREFEQCESTSDVLKCALLDLYKS